MAYAIINVKLKDGDYFEELDHVKGDFIVSDDGTEGYTLEDFVEFFRRITGSYAVARRKGV